MYHIYTILQTNFNLYYYHTGEGGGWLLNNINKNTLYVKNNKNNKCINNTKNVQNNLFIHPKFLYHLSVRYENKNHNDITELCHDIFINNNVHPEMHLHRIDYDHHCFRDPNTFFPSILDEPSTSTFESTKIPLILVSFSV